MGDRLIDIPIDDLSLLRDLYKIDWPKYSIGYGTVDTYVRWLNQDPKIPHLRILSLNGDWSDGTFVIIASFIFILLIYLKVKPTIGVV